MTPPLPSVIASRAKGQSAALPPLRRSKLPRQRYHSTQAFLPPKREIAAVGQPPPGAGCSSLTPRLSLRAAVRRRSNLLRARNALAQRSFAPQRALRRGPLLLRNDKRQMITRYRVTNGTNNWCEPVCKRIVSLLR